MKLRSLLFSLMAMVITLSVLSQELPPKHRGEHPRLQADGKVVDESGKQLGYITPEGKVCDATGKVLGTISKTGDVTASNEKGIIGTIQKDGSFKSNKGYVVTNEEGVLMVKGKMVGKVDKEYKDKSRACVVHCFFSKDSEDAAEIDKHTHH